jgi:hypothetical protein
MEHLIGRPTAEVVTEIARLNPKIDTFYVAGYDIPGGEGYFKPFYGKPQPVSASFIQQANWQEEARGLSTYVTAAGQRDQPLTYTCITSKVDVAGESYHIPMLDFDMQDDIKIRDEITTARRVLKELHLPRGVIIDSRGEVGHGGIHYMGLTPISKGEFRGIITMATARLFDGDEDYYNIDFNWAEMFEDKGMVALRLNSGPEKPKTPTVVNLYRR